MTSEESPAVPACQVSWAASGSQRMEKAERMQKEEGLVSSVLSVARALHSHMADRPGGGHSPLQVSRARET